MTQTTYRGLDTSEIQAIDRVIEQHGRDMEAARERLGRTIKDAQAQWRRDRSTAALTRDAALARIIDAGPYGTLSRVSEHLGASIAYVGRRVKLGRLALAENQEISHV